MLPAPTHDERAEPVHVLMWLAHDARTIPGGHLVQMDETARALRTRGHDVVVTEEQEPELHPGVDVVHGLGLTPEQVRAARQASLPVVMSTIWWPVRYRSGREMPWSLHRAQSESRRLAGAVRRAVRGSGPDLRAPLARSALAFESCAVLLPNGPGEAAAMHADTGVSTPVMTVPNGVDPERFAPAGAVRDDVVLMVGRVEPHKNQLGAIEALRGSGRRILVAGPPHPHHVEYFDACRRALGSAGEMLGRIPDDELLELYCRAAVHVLASWFETTGLATLEAAACGAPVVSTDRGFARDYFLDHAAYCDPARPASIAEAVDRAVGRGTAALTALVREHYTWARAAERTECAYEVALGRRPWSDLTEALLDAPTTRPAVTPGVDGRG